MPLYDNLEEVRKRAVHFLTPEVASRAGMTLQELQQTIAGQYAPTPEQVHALAVRMELYPEPTVGGPVIIWPKRCGQPRPPVTIGVPDPIFMYSTRN